MSNPISPTSGLHAQREFLKQLEKNGCDYSLMVADAFVRGIRDLGYKSAATALDELVDNAIQAGASRVHVAFGYEGASKDQPSAVAVIDDGHGMDAGMIRAAVMWGGTHREGDRHGFGRYGYGLPSASVSIGKRFTVFSWVDGVQSLHATGIDIDEISSGANRDSRGNVTVPLPVQSVLPGWLSSYIESNFSSGMPRSGTIVLIEKLDRLKWKTTKALQERLLEHFGLVYRNYLRSVPIIVHGRLAEAIDPLFLTAGAKFFKNDAQGLPDLSFEVKDKESGGAQGTITVRFAYLPPRAFSESYAPSEQKALTKARQAIMKETNGAIVLRHGRQIDIVRWPKEWRHQVLNNDRFYKIEIDFSPSLDEAFSVTTSKQQIDVSPRMWELLRERGVLKNLKAFRDQVGKELNDLKMERDEEKLPVKRPSEQAMAESAKFKIKREVRENPSRAQEAKRELEDFARRRAKASGLPLNLVEEQVETEIEERPYKVERENHPGAPFYRVVQRGGQMVLLINEGHRFYTDVYASLRSTPELRAGLEVLLFVMGECELESVDDRRRFYEVERSEWSRRLNTALDRLGEIDASDIEELDDEGDGIAAA